MRRTVLAVAAATTLCAPAAGQVPLPPPTSTEVSPVTVVGRRPGEARLELYEGRDLGGGGVIVVAPERNLLSRGFADRARSARAFGAWELCDGADFRPPCRVVRGEVLFLGSVELSQRVTSVRPAPGS